VAAAARNLGLNATMLGRWKREVERTKHGAFPGHGRVSLDQEACHRVREETRRWRMERAILQKALGFVAREAT
jgi:transposase